MSGKAAKRTTVAVEAITADEIGGLWRQATNIGPYPSQEDNEASAQIFNNYRVTARNDPEEDHPSKRQILNAIDLLSSICIGQEDERDPDVVLWEPDALALARALIKMRKKIVPYPEPTSCTWRVAACMVWGSAQDSLSRLGRYSGISRNSVTVRFIALVLRRMGWPYINEPGVEAFLQKAQDRLNGGGIQKA